MAGSRSAWRIAGLSLAALLAATAVQAENSALEPKSDSGWKQAVNHGTVQILTKGLGCTCTVIASDMANVLNEPGSLRILPVIGHGSLQGIADVMYLRGVDLSILQADVLSYVKRNNIHRNISDRVRYVTKLYNSELHLIAGSDIETIQDLDGKTVSYDVKGRGSFITAENVFNSIGVEVSPVHFERDVAIEKVRQGEIAAAFVVTGKPADSMRGVEPGDGLHFLAVPMNSELGDSYLPSVLTHDDYPKLIAENETVETISVPEVLAVYNWNSEHERYAKVTAVVDKFFANFEKFKESVRHPKWQDVDLRADLPGWQRFQPAQDWLDRNPENVAEEEFELKVGDRIIRVKGDQIEGIDDAERSEPEPAGQRVENYPRDEGATVRKIAASPLLIEVDPVVSSESDPSLDFKIRLSRAAEGEIALVFNTVGGAAKPDVDFKRQNGVMLIEPGVTDAELKIEIIDDQLAEGDEDLALKLSVDPASAEIGQALYPAIISDDD